MSCSLWMRLFMGMGDEGFSLEREVEGLRRFLVCKAKCLLWPSLWGETSPEDMAGEVVETCLSRAHQFRGSSAGELFAWADRILVRKLKNLLRKMKRQGKGISLAEYLERSRERIEHLLVATQTSPGERLVRKESSFRLLSAIEELSADEKDAIVLHYFHDWRIAEVADHLGRTAEAASGLLYRALKKLRGRLLKDRR